MNAPALLVIGGAHLDRIATAEGPFAPGVSNIGRVAERVGGSAFNAAIALRAFDTPTRFLGARGGDAAGLRVTEALEEAGVEDCSTTWLDRPTPSYTAILDERRQLVAGVADMALYELAAPRLLRRRHVRDQLAEARAVLVDANFPERLYASLAEALGDTPCAAIGVSPAKVGRLRPLLSRLSILFVSRAEAAALTGLEATAGVEELARALADCSVTAAVVTDGAAPAAILDDGSVVLQAPRAVKDVQDVTGAGDTLAAIAFLAWLEGASLASAVRLGMAAAATRITGRLLPGCRPTCESEAAALPPPNQS